MGRISAPVSKGFPTFGPNESLFGGPVTPRNRRPRRSPAHWEGRKRCRCRAHRGCPLIHSLKLLGGDCAGMASDHGAMGYPTRPSTRECLDGDVGKCGWQ